MESATSSGPSSGKGFAAARAIYTLNPPRRICWYGSVWTACFIPPSKSRPNTARTSSPASRCWPELLTYQTDVPQEGRIDRSKVDAPSDLRVSTFPTVHGEKAVIRLFDRGTAVLDLGELGYPDAIQSEFERQLAMPTGVLFLTGPAGSGKTTTIYAALRRILQATGGARNIVSVEDPVERVLKGVTQTEVRPAAGLTFARCLRSLMRQDPEVIVIGEVRDQETAGIAVEAGLTGHLVISTIHSGSAPGVFTRLLEMDVPPYLVASSVNFVVAQRLIRKLCPKCKRPVEELARLFGLPESYLGRACEPVGCEACFGTGYRGRTVIAEALRNEEPLRQAVLAQAERDRLDAVARDNGLCPLTRIAGDAVLRGVTSPAEMLRVLGPDAAGRLTGP